MSWRHSRSAGELDLKRPPAKAVLLALAHHADEYTGQCWPSIARLVLFTGLSERSVQAALSELEQLKLVDRTIGGNRRASVYRLLLPDVVAIEQGSVHPAGGAPIHPAGAAPPPAGGAPQLLYNKKDSLAAREQFDLPNDWTPSDGAMKRARKDHPDVDHQQELRQFINYNRARGTQFADIEAAWGSWLGRAKPRGKGTDRSDDANGRNRLRAIADRPR